MTPEEIEIYNPRNAKQLTPEQLAAMESFTLDEIKELAKAFPDRASQEPYLILKDTTKTKQINSLVTWPVFYDLRKMNMKQYVAHSFKSIFYKGQEVVKTLPVQDLTSQEAKAALRMSPKSAEGAVQIAAPQTAVEVGEEEAAGNETEGKTIVDEASEDFPDLDAEAAQEKTKKVVKGKGPKNPKKTAKK